MKDDCGCHYHAHLFSGAGNRNRQAVLDTELVEDLPVLFVGSGDNGGITVNGKLSGEFHLTELSTLLP